MGKTSRQVLGARAEDAVEAWITAAGMEVLGRNVRVGRLEVDLVVRHGEVVALVEVRTRGARSFVRALDSIDARKRARVRRAGAQLWRTRFSQDGRTTRMRFDAAAVRFDADGEAHVEYVTAAF